MKILLFVILLLSLVTFSIEKPVVPPKKPNIVAKSPATEPHPTEPHPTLGICDSKQKCLNGKKEIGCCVNSICRKYAHQPCVLNGDCVSGNCTAPAIGKQKICQVGTHLHACCSNLDCQDSVCSHNICRITEKKQ